MDSDVFLLVMSEHVLSSEFCQMEMMCAIQHEKPIQLVLEAEPRFGAFDVERWRQTSSHSGHSPHVAGRGWSGCTGCHNHPHGQDAVHIPAEICKMIDQHLPEAITYRRRDFENEAMMGELCSRNGLTLPVTESGSFVKHTSAVAPLSVFVICHKDHGFKVKKTLEAELQSRAEGGLLNQSIVLTTQTEQLATADRVLLLLTGGVLEEPSCGQLLEVLKTDEDHRDRIVALFSSAAGECPDCEAKGWSFGCKDHKGVPPEIKVCLNEHEAIQWQEKDPDGPTRHEFRAMVDHLVEKLSPATGAPVARRARAFTRQSSNALG